MAQITCPKFRFAKLGNLRNLESAMTVLWLKFLSEISLAKLENLHPLGPRASWGIGERELRAKLAFPSRELRSRRDFDNALGIEDGKSSQI